MIPIERVRVWERLMISAALLLEADAPLKALVEAQEQVHAADLEMKRMIAVEGMAAEGGVIGEQ